MFGLRRFGIKLGLDVIRGMLDGLGNPQAGFSSLHIAGTNGKGSVAATLSAILIRAGFCVGMYTSPHLIRFNERIQINGVPVSDEDVRQSYLAVKQGYGGDREPTFFEYTTAMALYLFSRHRVDWAVVEAGMGGRMDATNVLMPAISIITNVSLEHQQYLGNTIEEIAREKGGIIKEGTPVVTGVTQGAAVLVLEGIAAEKSAPLFRLGKDFSTTRGPDGTISYTGMKQQWSGFPLRLSGAHQVTNAALVLAACELLQDQGHPISPEALSAGLETTHWPGRLEVVSHSPTVILDGAHNLDAAACLATYLSTEWSGRRITLVIGILEDKPFQEILNVLLPPCDRVILTQPAIYRALSPESLRSAAEGKVRIIEEVPTVADAIRRAVESSGPDDVVCIAGSLYVVGEAKAYLENTSITEDRV